MRLRRHVVVFAIIVCSLVTSASASEHLTIGTKVSPPFSMKADDGTWTGISIELWKQIAVALDVTYDIKEYDLKGLLAAVQAKEVDVAVASTTITADREAVMDFTHPIYSTGLGILVKRGGGGGTFAVIRGLLTWDLLKVLGGLFVLLAATGALVWLFERRKNDAQFAKHPVQGIGAGVWWSAVTMTTVGYGDKSPITFGGRVLGLVWMFSAIIIISMLHRDDHVDADGRSPGVVDQRPRGSAAREGRLRQGLDERRLPRPSPHRLPRRRHRAGGPEAGRGWQDRRDGLRRADHAVLREDTSSRARS